MPSTPDRKPGPLEEDEEIQFVPNVTPPTQEGAFNYDGSKFQMRDATGVFDPRTGSSIDLDDVVLDTDGQVVYVNDGEFVMRL